MKTRELTGPPISGREDEWVIEWDGGHALARGVTAFLAHATVAGAPSFGACHCWRWTDNNGDTSGNEEHG